MKKKFTKILITFFLIILIFLSFMTFVGVKTTKFNNQIKIYIKNFNQDLMIDLKEIKILLDPINFEINVKTVGPTFSINEKSIDLENIRTQISIKSLIKDNFSLKNLYISTKTLKIENLISFLRNFKNTPEIYFLEKVFKKGYLISDIYLEFDEGGKIKDNYQIKGLVKDTHFSLFKKYNFDKINLIFDIEKNNLKLNDINLLFNNTLFSSNEILVNKFENNFLVEGLLENKDLTLNDKIISNFFKSYFSNLKLKKINFNSKNKFSFKIDKKFKIDDLKIKSKIELKNLSLIDNFQLNKVFPNVENEINLNNHLVIINYDKNLLTIDGDGNILLEDKDDKIEYSFERKNKVLSFKTNVIVDKNTILIDLLNYKKKPDVKAKIKLTGSYLFDKKTTIVTFSLTENINELFIQDITFDHNFKFKKFKKISLNYLDQDLRENKISITNKNNSYKLVGSKFNANNLIEKLIDDDNSNDYEIFDENFVLNIKIDQVYLDKEYVLNDLTGNLNFVQNEISNSELNALFSKNKKFKFTVKSNKQEKVTTLFLDKAEPIVKRYKFIKGFKDGSLDFYSSKKDGKSISNLKIYNFKLKELPILTKLLTLASLQGIADILSGDGITFDEFEMNFNNVNNLITIDEIYAIGPAISILMDGYIEKNKLVSLRGSLVPATTINKAIGTIPILGKILVGSKTGEGVFGVSFKIKGPPKKLETTVNPIKTLTPRFITRTLEKIKKN